MVGVSLAGGSVTVLGEEQSLVTVRRWEILRLVGAAPER